MQVVVCISGQFRTARACLPSLMKNLRSSCQVIYSISVWKEDFEQWLELLQRLNIQKVILKQYEAPKVERIPDWIYSKGQRAAKSTIPMYYLMQKSFEQIQNNLGPKDIVVRSRPDLYFTQPFYIDELNLSKVWLKHKISETYYSDQFFVADVRASRILFNTYDEISWYWQNVVEDDKLIPTGEKLFRRIIKDNNMISKEINLKIPIIREQDSFLLAELKKHSHFLLVYIGLKLYLRLGN